MPCSWVHRRWTVPDATTLPMLLKALRLPAFAKHWQRLSESAHCEGWSATQFLAALCEHELSERDSRRIQRFAHQSLLPSGKTLSCFDFNHAKGVEPGRVQALAHDTEWVRQAHNLILFGPSGVGKSHLAAAIGHAMIEKGVRVRYTSATALVQHLQSARQALKLSDALAKLDKFAVLIIDDLGYVKNSEQETGVLFELIAHRYESASLIVTANQPFSDWDQIFTDTMMTVAAVDRLVHHAHIIELNSDSYRRRAASTKRAAKTP
jgi:DNA replication protein DnaC